MDAPCILKIVHLTRTEDEMKYLVTGTFNNGAQTHEFHGEIEINQFGVLNGTIEDIYGTADICGFLVGYFNEIKFVKKYRKRLREDGFGELLFYHFNGAPIGDDSNRQGKWTIASFPELNEGTSTTIVLHPQS